MVLDTGDKVACPNCGYIHDEPVDDFVVPGYIGERSRATSYCDECDELFSVVRVSEKHYVLTSGE